MQYTKEKIPLINLVWRLKNLKALALVVYGHVKV